MSWWVYVRMGLLLGLGLGLGFVLGQGYSYKSYDGWGQGK